MYPGQKYRQQQQNSPNPAHPVGAPGQHNSQYPPVGAPGQHNSNYQPPPPPYGGPGGFSPPGTYGAYPPMPSTGGYGPPPGGPYPNAGYAPPPGGPYPGASYPPPGGTTYPPPSGGYAPPPNPNPYAPPPNPYAPQSNPYAPPPGPYAPPSGASHHGPYPPPPNAGHQHGYNAGPPHQGFQLSACTGRKRALLIGINYVKTRFELKGCINDVNNIKKFVIKNYNFRECDMVILTDEQRDPKLIPTRSNIIAAMYWLVSKAAPNDSFFLHFSGHGGQKRDTDGDEDDGYDETIMPVDFQTAGEIVDDEMHAILVRPLPPGCRLTVIFDSCHSGTALDLPYLYSTKGLIKEPNLLSDAKSSLMDAGKSYLRGDIKAIGASLFALGKKAATGQKVAKKNKETKSSPADVIMFSGCKDLQTSADTMEAGQNTGAMSYAFIKTLSQNKNITYQQLLNGVREILAAKYSQKPQLSSSHPMDMNMMFTM